MANIALIFVCLALGAFLRRARILPPDASLTLNRFVIYVSLPPITFLSAHKLDPGAFSGSLAWAIAMAWIIFGAGFLFFGLMGRLLRWNFRTTAALMLVGCLGNTSFVGFPLIEALYGPEGLRIAVLCDQPGTFLVVGTLGIAVASWGSGRAVSIGGMLLRILRFPPFIALVLGVVFHSWQMPAWLPSVLERLGATLIPVALTQVGTQLGGDFSPISRRWKDLCIGLGYKLVLAPILIALLYFKVLGLRGFEPKVIVLEAAMAPMITAGIVAGEYGLDSELASLMIGVGIPISFATVLAWWKVVEMGWLG